MVHSTRRKGKGRSRILYWFRTPPGVRVGRGPLDEEAIRTLEAGNPDVEFDWTRILKGQPSPEPKAPERRDPERREQNRGRERRSPASREPDVSAEIELVDAASRSVESAARTAGTDSSSRSAVGDDELVAELAPPATPAQARLGSEGVARLRARYSEMLARIDERVPEPERQAELKSLAERLNPDGWVTDADVMTGLESYETTFATIRSAFRLGPSGPRSLRLGPDDHRSGQAEPEHTEKGPEGSV